MRPPPASPPVPKLPPARGVSHQSQWPLPASGVQSPPINPHPRGLAPRGPPPARPSRPSEVPSQLPSPSIYSVRSGHASGTNLSYATRPAQSFSHPKPPQHPPPSRPYPDDGTCESPTSTVDLAPRISIATDELFRQSTISASSSIPDVPTVPPSEPPFPPDPRRRTAGLVAPQNIACRTSVSPISESEGLSNSRQTLGSFASSRAIPSWGSGPAGSEILGAYLDLGSDDDEYNHQNNQEDSTSLVRSASVGKRGKPTIRTIMKPNSTSAVSVPDVPSSNPKSKSNQVAAPGALAMGVAVSQALHVPSPARRGSTSTASNESCVDPEKPRFAQQVDIVYGAALHKEDEALAKSAPTMSDKRPGARKPPRLDIDAVNDAGARGSLSSLSDLIRRATKLASNLDRGRTASRINLAADADFKSALGKFLGMMAACVKLGLLG